jgi:hypothetical protein
MESYQQYLRERPNASLGVHEAAVTAARKFGLKDVASSLGQTGLEAHPNSLVLLQNYLQTLSGPDGKWEQSAALRALATTQRMEAIDPDYPDTYFARGDLCALGLKDPQRALTAFQKYLQAAGRMNAEWRQSNAAQIQQARTGLELLREGFKKTGKNTDWLKLKVGRP